MMAHSQPPQPSLPAEDEAGEGGEVVATFSSYKAPVWALKLTSPSRPKTFPTKQQDNVISIDCSDDDMEESVEKFEILSHSSPACESGLLASVSAPEPDMECLQVVRQLAEDGKLSPLQIEGAALAIQRHCRLLLKEGNNGINQVRMGTRNTPKKPDSSIENNETGSDGNKNRFQRAGFFLGDGAGIGKGRQISAVIRDSLSRSSRIECSEDKGTHHFCRRRHLWISVSRELVEDARRDLMDIGCHVPVFDGAEELRNYNSNRNGTQNSNTLKRDQRSGILFVTYAFLVSGKGKRLEDIISWLTYGGGSSTGNKQKEYEESFDGCIIFDEAHKAKNLCADPPTTTGLLVLELQERLPNARVMYCSATGVSDLKQMGYATRLGLWGPGTNFEDFNSFRLSLEQRGVGAMELLALEMKQAGCFIARTLSWDGSEFLSIKTSLTPEQIAIYNCSMGWWQWVRREIRSALAMPDMKGSNPMIWSQYWSAHQRFTKELSISAKVPIVTKDALKQLENGLSVVIGLQSTGEAGTQVSLAELQEKLAREKRPLIDMEEMYLPSLISTTEAIMASFIRNHFPLIPPPKEPIEVPPIPPGGFESMYEESKHQYLVKLAEEIKKSPPPEPKPELLLKKQQLLEAISNLSLPPAPLDELIDRLGGVENVAEMTGRSGRIIRSKKGGFRYSKRSCVSKEKKFGLSLASLEDNTERLNIVEKSKFMDGTKKVAIISDAASTGISLHAASKCKSCARRRVHYTIELPWAADKAIQQLGRTHRSGQKSAPIYKMIVTELGGERRFAAAVAKRMSSLGALTKGDRRAATGSDLSEFDIDSRFGRRSLKRLYSCLAAQPPYLPSKGSNSILDSYVLKNSQIINGVMMNQRLHALAEAREGLVSIGIEIGSDAAKNGDVKTFLNRISALIVSKQNLIFSLFTSTMDDVIAEAKATGEFEGSVEEVRATTIRLSCSPETLTSDSSSGALTKLAIFNVDRGCSLSDVSQMCFDLISPSSDDQKRKKEVIEKDGFVARSGFYISNRLIMGRTLVLFAKRKIKLNATGEGDEEADDIMNNTIDVDPLGLMILTRPNTGTNPCEMSTEELRRKYRLVASIDDIRTLLLKDNDNTNSSCNYSTQSVMNILEQKFSSVKRTWESTYKFSDSFEGGTGLAPRKYQLGMVTGSVLHCLTALEMSVADRTLSERSLKIIRVKLSNSQHRFVGMKYPVDEEAMRNLKLTIHKMNIMNKKHRRGFVDETPAKIQGNSVTWLTTAPVTMKNFFKTVGTSTTETKDKKRLPSSTVLLTPKAKQQRVDNNSKRKTSQSQKSGSITSFFKKR